VAKARPQQNISWLPWWLRSRTGRWLLRSIALLVVVAAFVGAVIWLGHWSRDRVDPERYLVPLAEVDCNVPDGMERAEFLDQVDYYNRQLEPLDVRKTKLPERLKEAFERHPWVANADAVTVTAPKNIAVRLTFRVPVLAVPWDGDMRAVDGAGILLPKNAPTRGLPVYDGLPRPPRGPEGTHWGDSDLEREARKLRADRK
jgi:hypothetical protein